MHKRMVKLHEIHIAVFLFDDTRQSFGACLQPPILTKASVVENEYFCGHIDSFPAHALLVP
jgi:hypothetical protein